MYEIDDDVPVPESKRPRIYPFVELDVGQSFFVPAGDDPAPTVRNRVASASRMKRLRGGLNGRKFTTACRTEDGVPGVRCWRVE